MVPVVAALCALACVAVLGLAGWAAGKVSDRYGDGAATLAFFAIVAPAIAFGIALLATARCGP